MNSDRTPADAPALADFEPLEARGMLSAPPSLLGISIVDDGMSLSIGRPAAITLTATDDIGITAATFFIDVNKNNEWNEGIDRHLGEVFAPDAGTTDRFSFTFTLDYDAVTLQNQGGTNALRFAATARDTELQWPVNAFTRDVRVVERPLISLLLAEPLSPTQTRLTARVGGTPWGTEAATAQGVTFWYDANNNGGWDSGIDIDLGYVNNPNGSSPLEFVLIANVNQSWPTPRQFAAAARDISPAFDRFGQPRVTIERTSQTRPPMIEFATAVPDRDPQQIYAGDMIVLQFTNVDAGANLMTAFRDVNKNGLWDWSIDEDYTTFNLSGGSEAYFTRAIFTQKSWDGGVISLAFALRSTTATGDDAWSPAYSISYAAKCQAWVEPTPQSSYTTSAGTPLVVQVVARDDNAVHTFAAFIDLDNNGWRGPTDIFIDNSNISILTVKNQARVIYGITLGTGLLRGSYHVGVYATDYGLENGPVTVFTLNVV